MGRRGILEEFLLNATALTTTLIYQSPSCREPPTRPHSYIADLCIPARGPPSLLVVWGALRWTPKRAPGSILGVIISRRLHRRYLPFLPAAALPSAVTHLLTSITSILRPAPGSLLLRQLELKCVWFHWS